MSAALELLNRAEQAGVWLDLVHGQVRLRAAGPPPPDLVQALRDHRDEIVVALRSAVLADVAADALAALSAPDPDLDAERAVMAAHYATEGEADPYTPVKPDPLRDGLLAGHRIHGGDA